jgi:Ca2+-binding RTX toxin-like protein
LLALLGLFGALVAGVAADAVLFNRSDKADDAEAAPEDDDAFDNGDFLADLIVPPIDGPDMITSDDLPDPVDLPQSLLGGDGSDVLSGGAASDQISGGGGNDFLDGRAGDDWMEGGTGHDAMQGGAGGDSLYGGNGNDTLSGNAGTDQLAGGAGDDSLSGGEADDSLTGGAGADTLLGGEGEDALSGGDDNDWLAGGWGDDTLDGGKGQDDLDGGAGNDQISGLNGKDDDREADFLNGGSGNDTLTLGVGDIGTGGEGDDSFVLKEWMSETAVTQIADYDPTQDQLVIVYDPAAHPDPHLTVMSNDATTGQTIYLDGNRVAVVNGAPVSAADIRLVSA